MSKHSVSNKYLYTCNDSYLEIVCPFLEESRYFLINEMNVNVTNIKYNVNKMISIRWKSFIKKSLRLNITLDLNQL